MWFCLHNQPTIVVEMLFVGDTQGSTLVGLAYQGKDIVFRFTIEYSSLNKFGP
jgi:hypothetical protein